MEMAIPAIPKVENSKAYFPFLGFSLSPEARDTAETVSLEFIGRLPDVTDGGSNEQTTPSGRFEHDSATDVCVPDKLVTVTMDVLEVPFLTLIRDGDASRLRLADVEEQCGE
jgi:hypothetical protein